MSYASFGWSRIRVNDEPKFFFKTPWVGDHVVLLGLLNHLRHMANTFHMSDQAHNPRKCSKKPILSERSVQSCPERGRREGRSPFDARSVRFVHERKRQEKRQVCEPEGGKMATMSSRNQGTPLAALRPDSGQAFFNIPLLCLLWLLTTAMSNGPCRLEQPTQPASPMMVRILVGACSEEDRKSLAVSAEEVFTALEAGQGVELDGVMLRGDLMLDALPLEPISNSERLPALVQERLDQEKVTEVHIIKGPLIFRHVDVPGLLATNLVNRGYLIVQGPVSITKSTFDQSVDFSRVIFQEPFDFSDTLIGFEGFFIKTVFLKHANFSHTRFGTHSRFHKAIFVGTASFEGAEFRGLAELLEVGFHQEADFSHVRFSQGTGFSGSQFHEIPDFSDATFEWETFFRFTQFEKGGNFRGSTFRKTADFTEAPFGGESNFSRVIFEEAPQFTDKGLKDEFREGPGLWDPQNLVGLFVLAGLILVFFYFLYRRSERKGAQ